MDIDLNSLCAKWQKILRLQDWRISIDWAKPRDLAKYDWAKTTWDANEMSASVKIRHPDSMMRKFKRAPIEHTVIHELMHVKLEGHSQETGDLHTPSYEAAIDHIAEVLSASCQ